MDRDYRAGFHAGFNLMAIVALAFAALVNCAPDPRAPAEQPPPDVVTTIIAPGLHQIRIESQRVTCWLTHSGISCLADAQR